MFPWVIAPQQAKRQRMWEIWNTALSLHGQTWIWQHVYSVRLSRTHSPNLNEEEYGWHDPSLCPEQGNETRDLRAGLDIPCHKADATSPTPHPRFTAWIQVYHWWWRVCTMWQTSWPSIAASSCCVRRLLLYLPAHPFHHCNTPFISSGKGSGEPFLTTDNKDSPKTLTLIRRF